MSIRTHRPIYHFLNRRLKMIIALPSLWRLSLRESIKIFKIRLSSHLIRKMWSRPCFYCYIRSMIITPLQRRCTKYSMMILWFLHLIRCFFCMWWLLRFQTVINVLRFLAHHFLIDRITDKDDDTPCSCTSVPCSSTTFFVTCQNAAITASILNVLSSALFWFHLMSTSPQSFDLFVWLMMWESVKCWSKDILP